MIKTKDIHKSFGALEVLKGIDLSIDKGEVVSIVGPSGAGKTTLLQILGTLSRPTSGEIEIDGVAVHTLSDKNISKFRNTKIGFVFQSYNLLPKTTALENVELPLIYRGMPREERRRLAQEALVSVGLEKRMDHRPGEMSGGQQQRVAIARAVAAKPPIIMADEPTGNLDSASGLDIMRKLTALNEQGTSIILITHDNHLAQMAKRIVTIQDGRIISDTKGGAV